MADKNLDKFLREAISLIVGKQNEKIADLLNSKKHVNEFSIAKKLDITINQARNLLYRIADQGIVLSIRKKDKRKGWYTYFWKLDVLKVLDFYRSILVRNMETLNAQLKSREDKQFYVCETCKVEFNEESALLKDFTCSECGGVFTLRDNTPIIKELQKQLNKLSKELQLVDEEIAKEREKVQKALEKENKKRAKEAAKKRAETRKRAAKKRAATRAAKKKANTKENKETKKKKSSKKKSTRKSMKKKTTRNSTKKKTTKKKPTKKKVGKKTKRVVSKKTKKSRKANKK